jgi:hypothetical protein
VRSLSCKTSGSGLAGRWRFFLAVHLLSLILAWPAVAGDGGTPSASRGDEEIEARRTNYEVLREYQKGSDFNLWPLEHHLDLNRDGIKESFLLFSEHTHFGTYSIFTLKNGSWVYLGQCSWGTLNPRLRRCRHQGWRDFAVTIHSSRNMITQDRYSWNPKSGQYGEHGWKVVRESDGD